MDTRAFKPLYDGEGPWTSVYLPTSRDETNAAHKIDLEWRALREQLARDGAPEEDLRALDGAVGADRGLDRPSGQAVFAAGGTVVLSRELTVPPPAPRAVFGDLPDAVPLLAQTPDLGRYLVVLVGREEALIELRTLGRDDAARDEHVRGRSRQLDRGRRQVENTWKANAREEAARVKDIAATYGVDLIAVGGDAHARSLLIDQLGTLGRTRCVELPSAGLPPGADTAHAYIEAERMAAQREYELRAAVLEHYRNGLRGGTAVSGLEAVVEALRQGDVAGLLLRHDADEADAPVWWGPEPGQLTLRPRELEGTRAPRVKRGRAADVLIRALVQTDGELLLHSGAEPGPEGVAGAILRRG